MIDLTPFLISFKLAFISTALLFIVAYPMAYLLAFKKIPAKLILETIIMLPIVLPPTVLGFYLLVAFSPRFPFGAFIENVLNIKVVFSFTGIVIASCIYTFPFMIQPLKSGLLSINPSLIQASYTLGKSEAETFFMVIVPNMKLSILSALITSFAHILGEFGVVMMIGGSIPGLTKVASIAIYERVEELDYSTAHVYALIHLAISFTVLLTVNIINRLQGKEQST